MIKNVLLLFTMLGIAFGINAQLCGLSEYYKEGQSVTMETKTYPSQLTDKFWKLKDEKKEAALVEIDEKIKAGEISPTITSLQYKIDAVTAETDNEKVTLDYTVPGYSINPTYICNNDTLYILNHTGPVITKVNGEIYSILIQGTKKIPLNLKVGDNLAPFDDYMILPPSGLDFTIPVMEYSETSTHRYYRKYSVEVRQNSKNSMLMRHFVNANVTGKEMITLLGQEYEAFIIESENWTKVQMDKSFDAENEYLEKRAAKLVERTDEKINKRLSSIGVQNEEGYTVTKGIEWYVPGIGIVRTLAYNIFGELQYDYYIKSIE